MADDILDSFLRHEIERARQLAAASAVLTFTLEPVDLPRRFVAEYRCQGLVREPDGTIHEADRWLVGISIPDNYLRGPTVDPFRILTWLGGGSADVFHPNIRSPLICIGRLDPGMDFQFLLYQLYEIITWQKFQLADCLNPEAAQWARHNLNRLPIDPRPLQRARLELECETLPGSKP
jgi:hypothetical protein